MEGGIGVDHWHTAKCSDHHGMVPQCNLTYLILHTSTKFPGAKSMSKT